WRDWLVRTAGLGIFILAALSVLGGIAISQRAYENGPLFARRAAGAIALALFSWGALGLNKAEWELGNVDFREVTLGGELGEALVSGVLAKLAWLSLLVIGMALVAPRATAWLARSVPVWLQTAWERRWPHRVVEAIGSFIAYIFRRPSREPEP